MKIIVSDTTDPYENLRGEQKWLAAPAGSEVLLLYINTPSVIVGRNQLPEAEANMAYCRREGIPVIKRLSGGGAVYHDEGNINYAYLVDATENALDRDFLTPVIAALQGFGIPASMGKRKELLLGDKKISGTASHITRGRQLFHGTLLFDTDMEQMRRVLDGDKSLRGRHVASVPSTTANLVEQLDEKMTAREFMGRLADFFEGYFNGSPPPPASGTATPPASCG